MKSMLSRLIGRFSQSVFWFVANLMRLFYTEQEWSVRLGKEQDALPSTCPYGPSTFLLPLPTLERGAWQFSTVRASNEGSPRPRVARAQRSPGRILFPSLYPSSCQYWRGCSVFFMHSLGSGQIVLRCAHRATTALSWGLCEHKGQSGHSPVSLASESPCPVQYPRNPLAF
jgi:hypothetical protein